MQSAIKIIWKNKWGCTDNVATSWTDVSEFESILGSSEVFLSLPVIYHHNGGSYDEKSYQPEELQIYYCLADLIWVE